jgi:hypothetical protein
MENNHDKWLEFPNLCQNFEILCLVNGTDKLNEI